MDTESRKLRVKENQGQYSNNNKRNRQCILSNFRRKKNLKKLDRMISAANAKHLWSVR